MFTGTVILGIGFIALIGIVLSESSFYFIMRFKKCARFSNGDRTTRLRLHTYLSVIGIGTVFFCFAGFTVIVNFTSGNEMFMGIIMLITSIVLMIGSVEDLMFREVEYVFTVPFMLGGILTAYLRGIEHIIMMMLIVTLLIIIVPWLLIKFKNYPADVCILGGADAFILIGFFGLFDIFICCKMLFCLSVLSYVVSIIERCYPSNGKILTRDMDTYGNPIESEDAIKRVAMLPLSLFAICFALMIP